jgi:cag pathogenicity island protein 13
MTILTIPTTNDPFQRMTVRLDGRDYVLELRFNQREDRWYLSIADDESVPLLSGLKLQANWPLLWRHRYNVQLPPGEIMAAVTTGDRTPPTLNDLGEGKRCELTYFDRAELLAAGAG